MKTAEQWLNEVGEVVMFSAFVGGKPPGNEVEKLVRRIQTDALRHAAGIVNDARGADETDLRSIRDTIKAEADKLEAQ